MEKKSVELMDRLKIVKVSSEGDNPDPMEKRPLPQMRKMYDLPTYGHEEPLNISEGKCTLRQALEFITNHQNDPSRHSIRSIAETYKMKPLDVEQVVNYFKVFHLYVKRDEKVGIAKTDIKTLGANKITQPLFDPKFSHLENKDAITTTIRDKK